jgi:hypothetical protein
MPNHFVDSLSGTRLLEGEFLSGAIGGAIYDALSDEVC